VILIAPGYAIGKVVDFISHSPYWRNTAIFILEDDAQSGGDHVDAHRSFGYAISPYSKRGVTISTNYNTVNVLRTIEDLLGIDHLNQSGANAAPMADVFTRTPNFTPYSAIIHGSLCAPPVDQNLVPACSSPSAKITSRVPELHDGAWWAEILKSISMTRIASTLKRSTASFGKGSWATCLTRRFAAVIDLRKNRTQLLKKWEASKKSQTGSAVPVAMAISPR
jgi:DNA-binding beta-propeller fold protein YncE